MTIDIEQLYALPVDERREVVDRLIASISADEGWGEIGDEERELVRERLELYRANPGGTVDWRPFIESLRPR